MVMVLTMNTVSLFLYVKHTGEIMVFEMLKKQ